MADLLSAGRFPTGSERTLEGGGGTLGSSTSRAIDIRTIWPGRPAWTYAVLERLLGLHLANEILCPLHAREGLDWIQAALQWWHLDIDAAFAAAESIPRTGAVVFVSNHPFGALDAGVAMLLLLAFRPDVRLLANRFYCRHVPGVASFSIGVDPAHLRSRTASGLRALIDHLDRGGAILTFPAGGVATYRGLGAVQDRAWAPGLARLVQRYQTPGVPIFFGGRNRLVYHVARRLHARLGAALLLPELLAKRGARVRVRIGAPIPFEDVRSMVDPVALAAYLRQRTYELGGL